ncbi:MAG: hypothetical protein K1Y01_08615 [Vicinamibacteria bacterium]|nr:hypothetical protein [Vicinamibacteria bacterium]
MKVTRKGFISSVATAVAATMTASASPALAGLLTPLSSADIDAFLNHVGSAFHAAGPAGARTAVVLQGLEKLPSDKRTDQFSLFFASPSGDLMPEGLYRMHHSTLGAFDIFLVPGGKKAALRADFSLLKA